MQLSGLVGMVTCIACPTQQNPLIGSIAKIGFFHWLRQYHRYLGPYTISPNQSFTTHAPDDTFLTKIPIAPCYCQMMGRTLKEEIKITQYNNPTKAGKYSLEDLFRASDNIPHHYPKF